MFWIKLCPKTRKFEVSGRKISNEVFAMRIEIFVPDIHDFEFLRARVGRRVVAIEVT